MKKLLFVLLTIIGTFMIYNYYGNKKINYVSIGDGLIRGANSYNSIGYGYNDFVKDYLEKNNRVGSFNNFFYNNSIGKLTKDIRDNRTIRVGNNEYFFKKVLRESDVLIISIGMEELFNNYNKDNINKNYLLFNNMYSNIENLIKEIKRYTKGTIIFLGYYNPTNFYDSKTDEFFYNMDIKLNRLMLDNDIIYIDLYEEVKGHRYHERFNTPFLNTKGYQEIANIIEYYLN